MSETINTTTAPRRGRPRLNPQPIAVETPDVTEEFSDEDTSAELVDESIPEVEAETVRQSFSSMPLPSVSDSGGTKVNFMNDSNADELFSRKPEPFSVQSEESEPEVEISAETVESRVNNPSSFTADDLADVSEFAIEALDSFASFGFAKVAGATSTANYELPVYKKKRLSNMLALILEKRNVGSGMSLELMFFVTIVLFYAPGLQRALQEKKRNESTPTRSSRRN